jgi:hypothetical protein
MKQSELVRAGQLGQQILGQQAELEARVRELSSIEARADGGGDDSDDELGEDTRNRLRDLGEAVVGWERENAGVWTGASTSGGEPGSAGVSASPSVVSDLNAGRPGTFNSSRNLASAIATSDFLDPSSPSAAAGGMAPSVSASSLSRRSRNNAHRSNDIEFATEIGQSLLVEVRRLQALLGERDTVIEGLRREVDEASRGDESMREVVRELEGSNGQSGSLSARAASATESRPPDPFVDKFREENWNLEVSIQDLRTQLGDVQATANKADAELKRLTKSHAALTASSDAHKNESLRLTTALADAKTKHETDLATMRKQTAGLQRDKSDLQALVEKAQKLAARAAGSGNSPSSGTPRKGGRGGRFGANANETPTRKWRDVGNEDGEDGEVDEFGVGGAGGGSTRRRGPGFDAAGNLLLSPSYR